MSPELVFAARNALGDAAIGGVASLLGGTAFAALLVPQIAKRVLPKPIETHLADFIPFDSLEADGATVRMRDGTVAQFIEVGGIDQTFLDEGAELAVARARKDLYDAFSDYSAVIRIFTIRERIAFDLGADFPNKYAAEVARRWNGDFETSYRTRTVLALSLKLRGNATRLDEAVGIVLSILDRYQPKILSQNPLHSLSQDLTVGEFLGRLVAPATRPQPKTFGTGLSDVLSADEVIFNRDGTIEFRGADRIKYGSVIGLRRLGNDITPMMANELATLDGEAVILQTVAPQGKTETLFKLKQQQAMVSTTSFGSVEIAEQYQAAIEMVEGLNEHRACLVHFTETIFLYADSEAQLKELEKRCRQILNAYGVTPVREKGASQASWFMQFPSYDIRPRMYKLLSSHAAMLATFERPAVGLPRSDWGPGPIALLRTSSNTVHMHQFHGSTDAAAVGHGLCIAPTGAGKTVLMEFLSCMAARHRDLRHFFFDRYQGTYVYTGVMNGKYLGFNSAGGLTLSIKGGMNPLQCEASDDNIDFLKNWLQSISGCNDADSLEQIATALSLNFETLEIGERSLAAVYEGAFTPGGRLREELQKWVDPNQSGPMFNAPEDCIDLDGNWLTTFDMTHLLDDKTLAGASVFYIMHRIRQSMKRNSAPGFIFIDETEPLLRNENFKLMYKVMLQEFRKIRGVCVSVFQRPEALRAMEISELMRQQCSAYYLFPNPGATAADYAEFELTSKELAFIMGDSPVARRLKRSILIKRPSTREAVIVDVDLSRLGPYLRIFSSSSKDVQLASDIQRQYGGAWVERYLDSEAP